jgi:arylformamidase
MLIDITRPIEPGMLVHPEDECPPPALTIYSDMAAGGGYNLTYLAMSLHSGTHLDAPRHFILDGATIDELPLDIFAGPAHVIDLGDAECALPEHLDGLAIARGQAVLFKTRNGELPRDVMAPRWAYISADAARRCVELGVCIVGMDYIEVESPAGEGRYPVHETVLGAGALLLENLDLRHVEPGLYKLYCFPLRVTGAEGGPCRAVLEL